MMIDVDMSAHAKQVAKLELERDMYESRWKTMCSLVKSSDELLVQMKNRPPVSLSDDELRKIFCGCIDSGYNNMTIRYGREIMAALQEKAKEQNRASL